MYKQLVEKITPELERALDFFKKELAKIRTGQASPALIEDILVDIAGQRMPVKQLAGISIPERRQILVQPWDPSYLGPIEKAIGNASLGSFPVVEGKALRLTLPLMTQEYRQSLQKLLSVKTEQAKQILRKWRDEAWGQIQQASRDKEIREDDKFKGKEELQRMVDEYFGKVDELALQKTKEIEL